MSVHAKHLRQAKEDMTGENMKVDASRGDRMSEPLTDEQLEVLLAFPVKELALVELERREGRVLGIPITSLVSEVRRLRSDKWLERAAEEIFNTSMDQVEASIYEHDILAILRKHRDV